MARPRTRDARADRGASAVEYAIILAGVAAGLMLVLLGLQRTVETTYRATAADIAVVSAPQAVATTAPAGPGPGPSSSSPAPSPSTSSPAPGPSRSTPTPTRPAGSIEVEADHTSDGVAIGWTSSSKSFSATITPSGSGSASIVGGKLVFTPDSDTRGTVTVSWKFKNASGGWVTGTTTFWVTS